MWVPARVCRQWKETVTVLNGKLRGTPASRHNPTDVRILSAFQNTTYYFSGNPFRVADLHGRELKLALQLERDHLGIDAGEAEALAMCIYRGSEWAVVLDDQPARTFALDNGIHTAGTLDLLVSAVRAGYIELETGEALLGEMRHGWPRAPRGQLAEYVAGGRPLWCGG